MVQAYLGEEQRRIPQDTAARMNEKVSSQIGAAPWQVHEHKSGEQGQLGA